MISKFLSTLLSKPVRLAGVLLVATMIIASCQPAATAPAANAPVAKTAVVVDAAINVASNAELGSFLVDGKGMTLYMFTKDEANKSNCDADCLKKWPPLITYGHPTLGQGVDASLVGSAVLPDGSRIVTYNKMPLYYWYKDVKPGDTDGQDVGEVWYVVSPDGQVVGHDTASEAVAQTTQAPAATEPAAEAFVEPVINIASNSELGSFLVGDNGMALYMFTKDEANKSNCNADCLKKWPPLLTQGDPKLGEGVDAGLLGVASLPDGSKIVTYNKMPLYYWIKDSNAGDTTGQGVGDVWYVVSPDGQPVEGMTAASADAPTAGSEPTISIINDPALGPILVGDNGMTLYIFTKDEPDKSNCNADCLAKWPPLLTHGNPKLGEGVDASLIGVATLPDGSMIVTYNHMPLYYWIKDTQMGDTTGQGVGEVWYVISPTGSAVTAQMPNGSPEISTNSSTGGTTTGSNSNQNGDDSSYHDKSDDKGSDY